MSELDYARLARFVLQRREQLGLDQVDISAKGGPGVSTLGLIENGRALKHQPKTKTGLEYVLGWEPGSFDAVLRGGEPSIMARVDHPGEDLVLGIYTREAERQMPMDLDVAIRELEQAFQRAARLRNEAEATILDSEYDGSDIWRSSLSDSTIKAYSALLRVAQLKDIEQRRPPHLVVHSDG